MERKVEILNIVSKIEFQNFKDDLKENEIANKDYFKEMENKDDIRKMVRKYDLKDMEDELVKELLNLLY